MEDEIQAQAIILAAAQHDLLRLKELLRLGSANVQDFETGCSPLHAAISACEPEQENDRVNDNTNGSASLADDIAAAEKTLKLLFENGAIWNDLDARNETPGCLALRLGLKSLYDIIVDAGVRAELLLMRLDEYAQLLGGDESDDEDEDMDITQEGDVEVEPIASAVELQLTEPEGTTGEVVVDSATYLQSALDFQDDKLVDADANGVMMAWETEIMRRSAEKLLPKSNLSVLNVGHGMGIVDNFIQGKNPAAHHIIEAHPEVLAQMSKNGWDKKQSVTVHAGTWQDTISRLVEENITFDAIYFDTFAEDYKAFREFFTEHVIALLKPDGRFGFFHGLGGDRQVCYDVYTKV